MKLNALRLLSIACLLLISSISYAADATRDHHSKNNAKVNVDDTDYNGDVLQNGKRSIGDAFTNQNSTSRSIGDALANKSKASQTDPDKKRIEELENIVSKQQQLIEMLEKKSNP
jgi:hypothetical protein